MSFHVGQRVVCVNNAADEGKVWRSVERPVVGRIYTVASAPFLNHRGCDVMAIAELENPFGGYRLYRFHPVVDDRKKISFTIGADPDSEKWDNRVPVRKKERV